MSLSIATNTAGINIANKLSSNSSRAADHAQNLATGSRITRASSDAAAQAIGSRLASLTENMEQARRNTVQGNALAQVAVSGAQEIEKILSRMQVLVSISNSDGVDDTARALANKEFQAQLAQIDKIAGQSRFNGTSLLDGSISSVDFQVNTKLADKLTLTLTNLQTDANNSGALALYDSSAAAPNDDITIDTKANSNLADPKIATALGVVRTAIATIGAFQAQLESAERNLSAGIENAQAAKASFVDANAAEEMINKSKYEMLMSTGFAALGSSFKNLNMLSQFVQQNA